MKDDEWAFVAPYLSLLPEDAAQRRHELRRVFDALKWVAWTGAPWRALTPQREKERTFEALLRQLDLLARRPVLIVFEDVHWIDLSARELLDLIVERVTHLPALLLITYRPEFQPPWTGQAHVTALTVNRRRTLALAQV